MGMTKHIEILNDLTHRGLAMRADAAEPISHFTPIVIQEFAPAASICPIFLAKDPEVGSFYVAALFGFEPGEVLVDEHQITRGVFEPLDRQRRGFFAVDDNIGIDANHPRFGEDATLPLFDDEGTPSTSLRKIQQILGQLAGGLRETDAFIASMLRLKLIEAIDISLRFDDGRSVTLDGLYTISRDNMNDLEDADVVALFRRGFLQAALCMSFSLHQIPVLAERRNRRLIA